MRIVWGPLAANFTNIAVKYFHSDDDCPILQEIYLINWHVLNPNDSVINLRISDDGRNVGHKVKYIIITYVDDIENLYKSNYYYTIILYSETKNYKLLQRIMIPVASELNDLILNGLKDLNSKIWTIKSYFSSD
ncbi:hypothetical protein C1645_814581 [Glomus cerebriforme]|uniref:Uncharacterized protein n=1 Tax=Glomus cerebriforme TaxID=658196 RepID=A0A397TGM0_9GLOM|nr:hypothetical protein C1645_814581 [Glomus cerebriforme]